MQGDFLKKPLQIPKNFSVWGEMGLCRFLFDAIRRFFEMSKLHTLLRKRGLTVTCAESCTGGLIAKLPTARGLSGGFSR